MKVISPQYHIAQKNRGRNKVVSNGVPFNNPSFKSGALAKNGKRVVETIVKEADEPIMKVFAKYYDEVGKRVGDKIGKIYSESDAAKKLARFDYSKGISTIREKKIHESLTENIVFPFKTLPMWTANWGLKKAQSIDALRDKATTLYRGDFFRLPRKLHELDEKTDIIKGIYEKTDELVRKFAKDNKIAPDEIFSIPLSVVVERNSIISPFSVPEKSIAPGGSSITAEAPLPPKTNFHGRTRRCTDTTLFSRSINTRSSGKRMKQVWTELHFSKISASNFPQTKRLQIIPVRRISGFRA